MKLIFFSWGLFCALLFSPFSVAEDLESILGTADEPVPTAKAIESGKSASWFIKHFPRPNSDQAVVDNYIKDGAWPSALLSWDVAVRKTSLESSVTGRAFYALLLYKSGLKVSGLEKLWSVGNPAAIDGVVKKLWMEAAPIDDPSWLAAQINVGPAWGQMFPGLSTAFKIRAMSAKTPMTELKSIVSAAPMNSMLQAKAKWHLIIALSLNNQAGPAAKELALLMKQSVLPVSMDLMNLTAGRLLYQNAYFDAAIKYYQKVPRTSDLWIEAQEEIGWTHLRKGSPADAIAVSKDILHPALIGWVSPEADLVNAMGLLRVCDYAGVLENLNQFSKRYKDRNARLLSLAQNANDPVIDSILEQLEGGRLSIQAMGKKLHGAPRAMVRDDSIYVLASNRATLRKEQAVAGEIYAKSLVVSGLQGRFDTIKKNLAQRSEANRSAALSRVQLLAQRESDEIQSILRKMHIVEAEVIEQISIADKIIRADSKKSKPEKANAKLGANSLQFPGDGEVWFDEIGSAEVKVKKGCVLR